MKLAMHGRERLRRYIVQPRPEWRTRTIDTQRLAQALRKPAPLPWRLRLLAWLRSPLKRRGSA